MEYSEDIQEQVRDLKEDLNKLRADLGGVLRSVMDATRAEAGEARERLETRAREQLDQFGAMLGDARDRGRQMAGSICNQIEHHPLASILGSLGAGFLIGFLAGRK